MFKRVFKKAFGVDLLRHAVQSAPVGGSQEPDLLRQAAQAAWVGQDPAAFVCAARGLEAAGRLASTQALRLARVLLDAGLAEQALALLDGRSFRPDDARVRALAAAEAHLRLGDPRKAALALPEPLAQDAQEAELLRRLVQALGDEAAADDWSEASELVWTSLSLGLGAPAAELVRRHLERGGGLDSSHRVPLLGAIVAAFRLAPPAAAEPLLRSMRPMFKDAGQRPAWKNAMLAAEGRPEAAEATPGPPPIALATCLGAALAALGHWDAAIPRLEPTRKQSDLTSENQTELARCVGQDLLAGFRPRFRSGGPAKVFNLFPFNGEFTLLELRLEEMAPFVDHFVIVEAARTFTGQPKPMRFLERRDVFSRFADKIVHVPIPEFPPHIATAWAREFFQRDSAVRGLSGLAAPDDWVIISDADEIAARDVLQRLPRGSLVGGEVRTFRFFLNYEILYDRPKIKLAFARAGLLGRFGSSWLRLGATRYHAHTFAPRAGWHFTSIADPAGLEQKFRSTSHQEWAHLDRAHFEAQLARIRAEGPGPGHVRRELGDGFPQSLLQRREALGALLL